MRWSIEGKTQAGFGLAFVLLLFVGVVSYRSTQDLISAMQWVTHTHAVIENLGTVLADVKAIEGDVRGFAITGREQFVAATRVTLDELQGTRARLRDLTVDNHDQQSRLDALEPLLAAKLAFSDAVIRTRKREGTEAAVAMIRSRRGSDLMAEVEGLIGEMQQEERSLLHDRNLKAGADGRRALALIFSGSVLALVAIGLALIVFRHDMSRLRDAESVVKESESRLQSILDNTKVAIYVKDLEGRFTLVNRELEKMLKCDRSQLLGRTCYELFEESIADVYHTNDLAALESEVPLSVEEEAPLDDGLHTFISVKSALRDADGVAYAMCGVSTDITERKRAENQVAGLNTTLELRTSELEVANQELEAFSYSVSHDLRAPLRHIAGYSDMLRRHAGSELDDTSRRYLDKIAKAATQMGVLIDDLLMFSRMARTQVRHTQVHLGLLVAQVVNEMKGDLGGRVIDWRIAPLPAVEGDSAMLKLALVNLIANAVKYTRTRPEACIEIGTETRDDEIVVFVRDNGVGFEPEYTHKLFGVFQRLHRAEEFEGTGIGLANVRRIVQRHGGRTWAEGQVDHGAAFYFSIPKVQEAA